MTLKLLMRCTQRKQRSWLVSARRLMQQGLLKPSSAKGSIYTMAMRTSSRITPYLFVGPALALFCFAVLGPVVATFVFSFFEWDGFGEMKLIGFDNYARAFEDQIFRDSFTHVTIYILLTLVLEVVVGLVLAGLITANDRGSAFFRVVFFIPVMLPIVVVAVIWGFVYNPDFGLVNAGLEGIGLGSLAHAWLGDQRTALVAVSVVSGWIFSGFYMAIFYAGMRQLPTEVIEAAKLDGASEIQIFRKIKVPMIRNVIIVACLLAVTGGFQSFDLFFVLTNGGPFNATEIPTTYLVRVVFRNQNVGYGSALAVIMTATVMIVVGAFALLRRMKTDPGDPA